MIVAIDPGRDKCGVALVAKDGHVVNKAVVASADVAKYIQTHIQQMHLPLYAVGDGTAYETVRRQLIEAGIPPERIRPVDEYKSSEIGRREYWRARPPKGWRRLLPVGLQVPPEPYDDFVAVELARRFLAAQSDS